MYIYTCTSRTSGTSTVLHIDLFLAIKGAIPWKFYTRSNFFLTIQFSSSEFSHYIPPSLDLLTCQMCMSESTRELKDGTSTNCIPMTFFYQWNVSIDFCAILSITCCIREIVPLTVLRSVYACTYYHYARHMVGSQSVFKHLDNSYNYYYCCLLTEVCRTTRVWFSTQALFLSATTIMIYNTL